MFIITIEDLKVCYSNTNLPLGKSIIQFESLTQKR